MNKLYENVLEEQIEKLTLRSREIEESSDPTVLRSNKLLDELHKEKLEVQLNAWRRGKPTIEAEAAFIRLCRAMGLEPFDFPEMVDQVARYADYKLIVEKLGFPEKCCERSVTQLAMCDAGDLPKPHIMVATGGACDVHKFDRPSLAILFNLPLFYMDVPLNESDKPNLPNLNYIANQLGEFIEWAEKKVPGVKYDEDKLIEMQEMDAIGERYYREIYQLMKHVPCPIGPLDKHRKRIMSFVPSRWGNMQKAIEYLRVLRNELRDRVASGKGPYPEERLRLLWSGECPQLGILELGKLLMKRKVAMPIVVDGYGMRLLGRGWGSRSEGTEYGDGVKLSPLQIEAAKFASKGWCGPGKRWVNMTLHLARDIGAQGIVYFNVIGCTPMNSMGPVVAERAEKELGIPVLNFEGRLLDPEYMSIERFEETLSSFIDKCFDWAGRPRQ